MKKMQMCSMGLAMSLALGGCATTTSYRPPEVNVPGQWPSSPTEGKQGVATDAAALTGPWWKQFGDPRLDQLIDEVLRRNNDLAAAAITVRRAQLQAGLAASALLPSVSVRGNTQVSRPLEGGNKVRTSSVTGGVSWEADLWGRLASQRNAAEWEAQATEEDRQAAALSLVGTTATLYWTVAYLNERIVASQQSLDYAQRTLTLSQAQHQAGSISGLDEAQALQAYATQQANHTQLLQQRQENRNALAILLDGPPGVALGEASQLPDAVLPEPAVGAPASVLANRPDLRAAEFRLRRALASVNATRTSYYPALTLSGSVGGTSEALSRVLSDPVATLGAGLILPFVQWRDMQRNVAVSQADYEQAVVGFRQSLYVALGDVENALSARTQYDAQGRFLTQAREAALKAERLSEARYRAGAVGLKTWLDAQEARRQADNNLALNRLNRLTNRVTLYQALGGEPAASTTPSAAR